MCLVAAFSNDPVRVSAFGRNGLVDQPRFSQGADWFVWRPRPSQCVRNDSAFIEYISLTLVKAENSGQAYAARIGRASAEGALARTDPINATLINFAALSMVPRPLPTPTVSVMFSP
jgi:hypothetical protein